MSEKLIDTLFVLLGEYNKVEVPIIQRDYAQGRKDAHTNMVRDKLLKDMKSAIRREGQPLDLNFVYGKAEGDKFIPIDGQQRLTTLFLLHLYAFHNDDSKTGLLHKFTYETRTTSRKFLEELIKNRAAVFDSEDNPSLKIEDSEWFQSVWKYDPTVQSVLTMLDDIKAVFGGVDNLAHCLTDQEYKPIFFKFLEMKDLGMEDSLYIKLNARGKSLTPFENFKARLIDRLHQLKHPLTKKFEPYLDREWTDLFWTKAGENFDQTYLAFFGVLLMNKGIFQDDNNWSITIDYGKIEADSFETAYYTLKFLCENPDREQIHKPVFNALKEDPSYPDRVLFYAVSTYLYQEKGVDSGSLRQWIRIIQNLTLNSPIDTQDLFRSAIDSINALAENRNSLLEYFGKNGNAAFFSREQVMEEQIKAQIILKDNAFAELLYAAEQHHYFSGQIRSALYYSKGGDEKYDKDVFVHYWEKINALFDSAKPKHGRLMRRALLTFGDYTLQIGGDGGYKTLCITNPKEGTSTPSMKRLFSNHGDLVRKFLAKLNPDGDIESQLGEMIKKSAVPKSDWRYCFIGFPSLFVDRMSESHLRLREADGEMVMVPNKSSKGFNYEIFLAALYESLKQHGIESSLEGDWGIQADRYLRVNNFIVRFKKGHFIFKDSNGTVVFETDDDDPITKATEFLLKKK
jgi:uncharacterized protein with ParB-like and HNH nuclease domain